MEFFSTYGFVPELMKQQRPKLAKALARARELAAEEAQAAREEEDASWWGNWPELPAFCDEAISSRQTGKKKAKRPRKKRAKGKEEL